MSGPEGISARALSRGGVDEIRACRTRLRIDSAAMPLSAGQSLSHYEVLEPLGAGAMGEVWLARDVRLDREVALKVLPDELADDEDRLRRFEREARAIAALNHPNVAGIHGVDQVGDTCFLALELVPGEDLAQRLGCGALPVDEARDLCAQIAAGLEAAHEAGVVHRDLKPANVRVTPEGVVKLLDFGLAKPLAPGGGEAGASTAEVDSVLVTEQGMVLGTPTYMSPEQARGRPVDRRADVWAFGCVLYECLTGRRAFGGPTVTDVLAAVVEREPDWSRLPADLPADVRWLLRRCLAKDPRVRLRDVGEARVLLSGEAPALGNAATPGRPARVVFARGLALAVVALAAGWAAAHLLADEAQGAAVGQRRGDRGAARQLTVPLPTDASPPVLSPDGTRYVYRSGGALWVRELAEQEPRELPVAGGLGWSDLTWSPDGEAVAFSREDALYVLPLGGSRAERRCDLPARSNMLSWGDDGSFLIEVGGKSRGIYHLAAGDDTPRLLDWIDPETLRTPHRFNPAYLPGAERFLIIDSSGDEPWIHVASLATRSTRPLTRGSLRPCYVAPGWLTWVDDGRLLVQRLDADSATLSGAAYELADDVDSFLSTGTASVSFSAEGTLIYLPAEVPARLEWVDRQGRVLGLAAEPRPYSEVRLDRSGRWLAASVVTPQDGYLDVWFLDLERGTQQRLTQRDGAEISPAWSPDGRRIAFAADWSGPPNVHVQDVSGGEPVELVPFDNRVQYAGSWSADGRWVVYTRFAPDGAELWRVDTETLERLPLTRTAGIGRDPEVSPDGRWIAYVAGEPGDTGAYVATYPDLAGARRVSSGSARQPRWSGDGSEVYFLTESGGIAAVAVGERDGLPDPGPEVLVIQPSEDIGQFDVTGDAERFLVLRRTEQQLRPVAHLVLDWERLVERDAR